LVDDLRLRGRCSCPPIGRGSRSHPPCGRAPHLARLDGASGAWPTVGTRPRAQPLALRGAFPADLTIKCVDKHLRGFRLVRSDRPKVLQRLGQRRVLVEHARRGGTPNGPGPFRSHERTTPSGKRADPKRNQPVPKVPGNPTWAWQLVRGDRVGGLAVADDGFGDRQAAVETRRCDARQFRLLRRGDAEVPPCLDCYPVATYRQVPSGGSQVVGSWSPLDSLSCASTPTSVRGSLRSL
jgi:hypothetical protein